MARPKPNAAERGRAAWPRLKLDEADFLKWLGPRAGEESIHAEELWLARACLLQVPGAVATFEREVLKPALAAVPEDDREDVGQRVMERLLAGRKPKLEEFEGRGSLARWLKLVVLRESRAEAKDDAGIPERLSGAFMPSPDSQLIKARSQAQLKKALVAAVMELDEQDKKLLAMHHLDGVPHGQIGKSVDIPRSTIAWKLQQARQRVLEATKRHLLAAGLKPAEVESLFGVVSSHVDMSLSVLR